MKTKYRIVTDRHAGYECQVWRWYWPFWTQIKINTHSSLENAQRYIERYVNGPNVVWKSK